MDLGRLLVVFGTQTGNAKVVSINYKFRQLALKMPDISTQ